MRKSVGFVLVMVLPLALSGCISFLTWSWGPPTGNLEIGMTQPAVIKAIGRPTVINRTVTSDHVSEQWVYRASQIRRVVYLYFEDGALTAWQD